jgi:hypothetical protein
MCVARQKEIAVTVTAIAATMQETRKIQFGRCALTDSNIESPLALDTG